MRQIVVVSVTSFALALGAIAALDAYTFSHVSAAQPAWLVVPERSVVSVVVRIRPRKRLRILPGRKKMPGLFTG
jgi:hypothetical protein